MAAKSSPQDQLAKALELAENQQSKKQYQEAIATLLGALDQSATADQKSGGEDLQAQSHTSARCHQNLARLYRQRAWLGKARWHGRMAAVAFSALDLPREVAAAQAELGDLELAARQFKTALAWYNQATASFAEIRETAQAGLATLGACQAQAELQAKNKMASEKLAEVRFHAIHAVECHGNGQQRLEAQSRAESIARLLGEPQAVAWHMEQQIHLLTEENHALQTALAKGTPPSARTSLAPDTQRQKNEPQGPDQEQARHHQTRVVPHGLQDANSQEAGLQAAVAAAWDEYLSKAAHDMKEPLRMISSFGALLDRRFGPALGDEGQDYLGMILDAGQRMTSLMEKLVQHAQWGVEKPGNKVVALDDALLMALQAYREQQAAGSLVITHEHLGDMPGINAHWQALFAELLANAVRFHTDDVVRVHVERNTQPDMIWLRFSDNGIGIEEAERESVFALFRRLQPRSKYAGSGIGLAIVARITALYGGHVKAEAAPGGGTCIVLGFPQKG